MPEITSADNPRLKSALKLHSSRGRKKQNRFLVFGRRECLRCLQAGFAVQEIFVSSQLIDEDFFDPLRHLAPSAKVLQLSPALMASLEFGDRCEGIALTVERPTIRLSRIAVPESTIVVVLESIDNPGNLGAILRSCDGAGVDTVILSDPVTDFFHPNCIRASLGAVFHLSLATAPTVEVVQWLDEQQFSTFPAIVDAETSLYQIDFSPARSAIVFGNEARGLGEIWLASQSAPDRNSDSRTDSRTDSRKISASTPIRIPMRGAGDSLNVSVSVALVAYEASRQRAERRTR